MSITAGQDILASDFVSSSSGAGDSGKVAKLDSAGKIPIGFVYQPQYAGLNAAEAINAAAPIAVGPYQSDGGIGYDTSVVSSTAAVAGAKTISFTVGANSNRMLVVFVQHNGTTISGITYNGVAMTAVPSAQNINYITTLYFSAYYLFAPATGANNLVISGLNGTETFGYAIYSYYNVAQSISTTTTQTAASAASVSKAITPANVASMILAGFGKDAADAGTMTNTNCANNNATASYGSTNVITVGDSYKVATTQSITVGQSRSTGTASWALVLIEIAPVTAASYRAWHASAGSGSSYGYATNWKSTGFLGFSYASATLGNPVTIVTAGVATGLSSLNPGVQYYLADTAGTIATSAGTNSRKVGVAASTTELAITNIW